MKNGHTIRCCSIMQKLPYYGFYGLVLLLIVVVPKSTVVVWAGTTTNQFEISVDGTTTITTTIVDDGTDVTTTQQPTIVYPKDPNLQRLKEYDIDVYVRPDVSTFYRDESGNHEDKQNTKHKTNKEVTMWFQGLAGKFINISPRKVSLWVIRDDGNGELISDIEPWGSGGTSTYPNNQFVMTLHRDPDSLLCMWFIEPGISVYYCDPFADTTPPLQYARRSDIMIGTELDKKSLSKKERRIYKLHQTNLLFGDDYQKFTNGSPWLTLYPPIRPQIYFYPANYFGQEHSISTIETQYHTAIPNLVQSLSSSSSSRSLLSINEMRSPDLALNQYRYPGTLNLTLRVLSCTPRILEISNFISDVEIATILELVQTTPFIKSGTGSSDSTNTVRTSQTAWIERNRHPVVNTIYRRVADVLHMNEALLRDQDLNEVDQRIKSNTDSISEPFQIVYYNTSQQYKPHYDFIYPDGVGDTNKVGRVLNFAIYLNTVKAGGGTAFPKWRNGHTDQPLTIQPKPGTALLFYLITPDGNYDDLSSHAGLPVLVGEKYFLNLWLRSYV